MGASSGSWVLRAARVIDARSDRPLTGVELLIQDGRIQQLRPIEASLPPDVEVEDFGDATILPGLVDAHVHYTIDSRHPDAIHHAATRSATETAFVGARNARTALQSGVTTARSAGAAHDLDIGLASALAMGLIPGPRLLAAGRALTITGGHGQYFGIEVDDIAAMVTATRRLVRDGAEIIKVIASEAAMMVGDLAGVPELDREEIAEIVTEAARLGRRVMAHAQSSDAVVAAAQAGVTSVEHAFLADARALEVLLESGAYLTPTLSVTDVYAHATDLHPEVADRQRTISRLHRASCERAIALGIPMLAGSDCGVPRVEPDVLPREVRLLHEHGLSPMAAIKAATANGAEALGIDGSVGTIAAGKQADLVVVRGDPLLDLRALEKPLAVLQRGEVVVRDGMMVA